MEFYNNLDEYQSELAGQSFDAQGMVDDIRERIACGVQGEAFRRRGRQEDSPVLVRRTTPSHSCLPPHRTNAAQPTRAFPPRRFTP